jgi:hypothetical protein
MSAWLDAQRLDVDALRVAVTARAQCDALLDALKAEVDGRLPSAIALAGGLAPRKEKTATEPVVPVTK